MRIWIPLIFGIAGVAVLASLGIWQVKRLAWKEALLKQMESRLTGQAEPLLALSAPLNEEWHNYRKVSVEGTLSGREAHVLASERFEGPGYRIVSEFTYFQRKFFVDLGFVEETQKNAERPTGRVRITGNLLWPDDYDPKFTPAPDLENNIWFARHLPSLSAHFEIDPILIVASEIEIDEGQDFVPYTFTKLKPVTITGIPNDHLEYAITWFSLALVWAGMTAFLLWRIRGRNH